MDTKQVLVVRSDLKMVRGKEDAQCGHAAMAWIACRLQARAAYNNPYSRRMVVEFNDNSYTQLAGHFSEIEVEWLGRLNKKVALTVSSEQELLDIAKQAKEAGILCYVIKDEGLTQFNGVPTNTCLALGPDLSEKIDKITGHLKLR